MKRTLALTATALLCASAVAQEPGDAAGSPFDALDADRSGSISQTEAQAHATVAQNFAAADANSDGNITREEFDAAFTSARQPPLPEPQQQPPPQQ